MRLSCGRMVRRDGHTVGIRKWFDLKTGMGTADCADDWASAKGMALTQWVSRSPERKTAQDLPSASAKSAVIPIAAFGFMEVADACMAGSEAADIGHAYRSSLRSYLAGRRRTSVPSPPPPSPRRRWTRGFWRRMAVMRANRISGGFSCPTSSIREAQSCCWFRKHLSSPKIFAVTFVCPGQCLHLDRFLAEHTLRGHERLPVLQPHAIEPLARICERARVVGRFPDLGGILTPRF